MLIYGSSIIGITKVEPKAQEEAPALAVTAVEIARAYEANEVAAQLRFGNHTLEITGGIVSIALDAANKPVLHFRGIDTITGNVSASFSANWSQHIASMATGQTVTIRCSEITEIMGSAVLSGCSVPPIKQSDETGDQVALTEAAADIGSNDQSGPQIASDTTIETANVAENPFCGPNPEIKKQVPSLDGGYIYAQVCSAPSSDIITQVRKSDGTRKDIGAGNNLAVIRNGPYRGYLLLERHKYYDAGGSYDATFIVRPDNVEILEVPDSRDAERSVVNAWLAEKGWSAS